MNQASAWAAVAEAEARGIRLRLVGDRVRATLPQGDPERLTEVMERLRSSREQVVELLRQRGTIPSLPPHVKLVEWSPKEPPIAIDTCSVVVDVSLFIKSTLSQLGDALADPKRWVGWTVPQLMDRLRQAGVAVELDAPWECQRQESRE
jgi:hypothetical protein